MYYYPTTNYGSQNFGNYPYQQPTASPQQNFNLNNLNNQNQNNVGLKGRPVSSIEEVRAAQVDFDGSLFIFPDIANKKIYTKQVNADGTSSLCMYKLEPIPQQSFISTIEEKNFVTKDELTAAFEEFKKQLQSQIQPSQKTKKEEMEPILNF